MNAVLTACLGATFLLLYAFVWALAAPITLAVKPSVGFAPLTIRTDVRIPRHADNRETCVVFDGIAYARGSCQTLDGEAAQTLFTDYWPDLPAGHYTAQATLRRGREVLRSNPVSFQALGE